MMVVHAIRRGTSHTVPTGRAPESAFARLAKTFGGRVESGPEWFYQSLHFQYQDVTVSLGYLDGIASGSDNYWTYIMFPWPDEALKCEIRPQPSRGGMPSMPGTWKVLLDEPPFDADYYLTANDQRRIAQFLTPQVRERLHELFWLRTSPRLSRQSIYLRITGGQL